MNPRRKSLIGVALVILTAVMVSGYVGEIAAAAAEPERPESGVLIKKQTGQKGKLRIKNKSNLDAVLVLTLADKPQGALLAVYVRGGEMYMTTGIKAGSYRCYFTHGEDWDEDSKRFTKNAYYLCFKDPMKFTGRRRTYHVWTVTLGPVENLGPPEFVRHLNLDTYGMKNVEESEFPTW
jgi:hypothetical protein